jgi:hypothetical protein
MGDSKDIEMFDSIPKFDTYSKYSYTLGRIFKNSSLNTLIRDLKNPKRFDDLDDGNPKNQEKNFTDNIANLESQIAGVKNIIDEDEDYFDEKYDLKNLNKKKQKEEEENGKEKEPITIVHRKKKVLPDSPDPYKYHPNYNAIYKNIPSVKFKLPVERKPLLKKIKEEEKNSKILDKKIKLKPINPEKKNSVLITDINIEHNNTSKNNISTQVKTEESKELDKSKISTKKKKDLPPIDKSNHALRFSQYTWRKFIIPEQNEKISYLEPFDYLSNIDKTVDFTKMHFRNEMDMLNKASLETPSINYYHPSYKLLEERSPKVIFSPSSLRKNNKRYLLNKLWASYDVTQEYKLVNNEKLGEPNFDYLQIKNEK